jgi:hypothetical protein
MTPCRGYYRTRFRASRLYPPAVSILALSHHSSPRIQGAALTVLSLRAIWSFLLYPAYPSIRMLLIGSLRVTVTRM